jgi:hypothetical protein
VILMACRLPRGVENQFWRTQYQEPATSLIGYNVPRQLSQLSTERVIREIESYTSSGCCNLFVNNFHRGVCTHQVAVSKDVVDTPCIAPHIHNQLQHETLAYNITNSPRNRRGVQKTRIERGDVNQPPKTPNASIFLRRHWVGSTSTEEGRRWVTGGTANLS